VLAAAYVFAASGKPQAFDLRTVGDTADGCLALLDRVLVAPAVVAAAACWAVGVAVVVTVSGRDALRLAGEDPIAFLRGS
jgi:hypothetical protein